MSTSIRTQLRGAIGGVVLLTVLLFAGATYLFVVRPAGATLAARDMRESSGRARGRVDAVVKAVEGIVTAPLPGG